MRLHSPSLHRARKTAAYEAQVEWVLAPILTGDRATAAGLSTLEEVELRPN